MGAPDNEPKLCGVEGAQGGAWVPRGQAPARHKEARAGTSRARGPQPASWRPSRSFQVKHGEDGTQSNRESI